MLFRSLDANNNFTGNILLTDGTLSLGSLGAIGASGTIKFDYYGILQFTNANTTDYSSRFSTGNGQRFNIDTNGQTVSLGSPLNSTGGLLQKYGAGTLILSNTGSSYTGGTYIYGGSLQLGASNVIPDTSTVYTASGASFDLNGFSETVGGISGSGTITNLSTTAASVLKIGRAHV